jgi:hypothetical protein
MVHTGKKDSKKKPYTETQGPSYSYKGREFKVHFKIKSEKTDDGAKKAGGRFDRCLEARVCDRAEREERGVRIECCYYPFQYITIRGNAYASTGHRQSVYHDTDHLVSSSRSFWRDR